MSLDMNNMDLEDLQYRLRYPDAEMFWDDYRTWSVADLRAARMEVEERVAAKQAGVESITKRLKEVHESGDEAEIEKGMKAYYVFASRLAEERARLWAIVSLLEFRIEAPSANEAPLWENVDEAKQDALFREVKLRSDGAFFCEHAAKLTAEGMTLEAAYDHIMKQDLNAKQPAPFSTFASFKKGFYERGFAVRGK